MFDIDEICDNSYRNFHVKGNDRVVVKEPALYGLFDFYPIVKKLDDEFKNEIKAANRQAGFYAIKDGCRLEYRSLPNSVFETELAAITKLLNRIGGCVL